jgi:hypothetical protein
LPAFWFGFWVKSHWTVHYVGKVESAFGQR